MLSVTYFVFIFVIMAVVAVVMVSILTRKSTPLRKAWLVYSAMYILHTALFLGVMWSLPATLPSTSSDRNEIQGETVEGLRTLLKEQQEDIAQLKDHLDQMRMTIWFGVFILMLFAPWLYYNLVKYNLEIERISGKRMGSFD